MLLTSHSHNIKHHSSLFCISTQYAVRFVRERQRLMLFIMLVCLFLSYAKLMLGVVVTCLVEFV